MLFFVRVRFGGLHVQVKCSLSWVNEIGRAPVRIYCQVFARTEHRNLCHETYDTSPPCRLLMPSLILSGYSRSPHSNQTTTTRMFGHGGSSIDSPAHGSPSYHMTGCESDGEIFSLCRFAVLKSPDECEYLKRLRQKKRRKNSMLEGAGGVVFLFNKCFRSSVFCFLHLPYFSAERPPTLPVSHPCIRCCCAGRVSGSPRLHPLGIL